MSFLDANIRESFDKTNKKMKKMVFLMKICMITAFFML